MSSEKDEPVDVPEHPFLKKTAAYKTLGEYVNLFCPGCGYGVLAQSIHRAFEDLKIDPRKYPQFVGIGCHSLISFLIPGPVMMVLHGRALPFATGIRLSNSDIQPVLILGDGDTFSIGTNHFVHAARRNLNVTALVTNNLNFAMTGGQSSPTTPKGSRTRTSNFGYIERPMDTVDFAKACGATYIARWTTAQPRLLTKAIAEAIQHEGFSFVDIRTPCVTYFGRLNWQVDPVEMQKRLKESCVKLKKADNLSEEELETKIVVGKFYEDDKEPTLWKGYEKIIQKVRGERNRCEKK